ncbi:RNA polymerase sigma factor [Bacillus sp. EAC]|uniref:RNA polymerase sigma factor n=1 Tax=Bacillus sp. EAC TaxID=1978338 RepID=UPI000B436A7B|nr:RNA polymerase sigma factor [Bacillus sp. EAC]
MINRESEKKEAYFNRWMNEIKSGNQQAFSEIYKEFAPRIYGYFRIQLKNESDIQDLMQLVFLTIWRSAKSYHAESSLSSWIFGIARHKLLDYLRQQYKVKTWDISDIESMEIESEALEQDFTEDLITEITISNALDALPPSYAELLYLVLKESMSYKEISYLLKIPIGTVKSRMYQAKIHLKKQLQMEGGR